MTVRPFTLELEPTPPLARRQVTGLLRLAQQARPQSADLALALADRLQYEQRYDEIAALLTPFCNTRDSSRVDPRLTIALASALLKRDTETDARTAEKILRVPAPSSPHRSLLLAKAFARQRRHDEARAILLDIIASDQGHIGAYRQLASIDLELETHRRALKTAEELLSAGVAHAPLLLTHATLLGRLGNHAALRQALAPGPFLLKRMLDVPEGWSSLAAFNAALSQELCNHPDLRFCSHNAPARDTWRINRLFQRGGKMAAHLQAMIHHAVEKYVAALKPVDTWSRAQPNQARLNHQCVMTEASGYEDWHFHDRGWLSGVYYSAVPDAIAGGDNRNGCILFGLPPGEVDDDADDVLVRPEAGLLILFPSHIHHRTFAHKGTERRICIAFDIEPLP